MLIAFGISAHAAKFELDWDNQTWPPGSLAETFGSFGGGDVQVTFSGDTHVLVSANGLDSPSLNSSLPGGLNPLQDSLTFRTDFQTTAQSIIITLNFTHPGGVSNVQFSLFDIDHDTIFGIPTHTDVIQVTASDGSLLFDPTSVVVGPNTSFDGVNSVTGLASCTSPNSADCNVDVTFGQSGITSVTFVVQNLQTFHQDIGIHDISFNATPVPSDISGTVFEDTNFTGTATDWDGGVIDVGIPGVRVELYDAADAFVEATTTGFGGSYLFTNKPAGAYKVRAVSATIGDNDSPPQAGFNSCVSGSCAYPLPEMTWGNGLPLIGGQNKDTDDTAISSAVGPGDTYAEVTLAGVDVTDAHLGFVYTLVVTTQDDSNSDSQRSRQGSLRQFLKNANAISGDQRSVFQLDGSAPYLISLVDDLPRIEDADTGVDATTQSGYTFNPLVQLDGTGAGGGADGFRVEAARARIRGFIIRNFEKSGIFLKDGGNARIERNWIGLTAAGGAGGGNEEDGIKIESSGNLIGGNGAGNVISGNDGNGINIENSADNTTIQGNLIGTDPNGAAPVPNGDKGIEVLGSSTTIGGTGVGEPNIIAFNQGPGIVLGNTSTQGNSIRANSIHSNAELGIDVHPNGVNRNDTGDTDNGANLRFNFPVIQSAIVSGGSLVLSGWARPGSMIDFFEASVDPTNFGEGRRYLDTQIEGGFQDLDTTIGSYAPPVNGLNQGSDTTNRFQFVIPVPSGVSDGTLLVATGTDSGSNTSEFSGVVTVAGTTDIDLSLAKTADVSSPPVGSTVTFTVTLSNASGFSDATGVQVTDLLPSGYSYVSDDSAATSTSYNSTNGVWDVGNLTSGASVDLNVVATVLASGDHLNVAEVTAADHNDVDSTPGDGTGDDYATVGTTPAPTIDLSVVKVVDDPTPGVGSDVVFTITVANAAGFSDATGVVLTDILGPGYVYVSDDSSTSGTSYNPISGSWVVGNLINGTSLDLNITATVLGVGPYDNVAEVSAADQVDIDSTPADSSGDDYATVAVNPTATIDLSLAKVVDLATPDVGADVVFTVSVANAAGLSDATGVQVTDLLPSGYAYVGDDSASSGTSYAPGSGIWNIGALAAGDSVDLNITATVLGSAAYANAAEVTAADQVDLDSTPGDGTGDDHAVATPTPSPIVDLSLLKTVDDPTPGSGDDVIFTITVSNAAGFSDASGVEVSDLLPSGYSYVSDNSISTGTTYTPGSGLWDVGALTAGGSKALSIRATVLGSGNYLNVAEVSSVDQPDTDSTPGDGAGDDYDSVATTPTALIDLSLTLVVDNPTPAVGSSVAFTIEVSNLTGLSPATGVQVIDVLPSGYAYLSDDSGATGTTYDAVSGVWDLGGVAPGASVSLNVSATVLASGNYVNEAEVVAADQPDVDSTPGDGSGDDAVSVATIPIPTVDLYLTKTVDNPTPSVGTSVTFSVTVGNESGFSDAGAVQVLDALPSGFAYVADDSASSGTLYSPVDGKWDLSAIAAGTQTTLNITATVLPTGGYTNVAEVVAQVDPDFDSTAGDGSGDDYDTIAVTPSPTIDLELGKTVDVASPNVGSNVEFTLTLTNLAGFSGASSVEVTDLLPSGFSYVSDDSASSASTYNPVSGVWDVGNLASGATVELKITATVLPSGGYVNTAQVTAVAEVDIDSVPGDGAGDDFAVLTVTPTALVDVSLAMVVDTPNPAVGNDVVFTITVANAAGLSHATGVQVTDLLPSGYAYYTDDSSSSGTIYSPGAGIWDVGTLASGTSLQLNLTATVLGAGVYTNVAEVTAVTESDLDSTPGDGTGDDFANVSTTPTPVIDLSVNKAVDNASPAVGSTVEFSVNVANAAGFSDATGIVVTDQLPSGYSYLSDDSGSSGTSYVPATGAWTVGSLSAGSSVELKIQAAVLGTGDYSNVAEVTAAGESDFDSTPGDGGGDDHDSAAAAPNAIVDLSLSQTVTDANPNVGTNVTFSISVSNASGFSEATGVRVSNLLPTGLPHVADDSASTGTTFDPVSGEWNVGTVATGATVTLQLTVTVLGSGTHTNVAEVIAADQPDDDSTPGDGTGDDYASLVVIPNPVVDLSLNATIDDAAPLVGSTVTLTVSLVNAPGFSDASGVQVVDLLPNGLAYVSDDSSSTSTTYIPGSGVWDAGNVAAGDTVELNITATVLPSGTYQNVAEVTAADQPDTDSTPGDGAGDDFASVLATPVSAVDLEVTNVVDNAAASVGSSVTFTVTVSNEPGFSDASGVQLVDLLPSGYAYVGDDSGSTGTTYSPATGVWDVGTVVAGTSVELALVATVLPTGSYVNTAEVTSADQIDIDSSPGDGSGDDFASVSVAPGSAIDLSLTKIVDITNPVVGSNVVFTITLSNAIGLSHATGIEVMDLLPSGFGYLSDDSSASGTSYNPATGVWAVGALSAGSSVALNLSVTVLGGGSYGNTAEVTAADQADIDSTPGDGAGDDFAPVNPPMAPIPRVDLSLSKSISDPTPIIGSQVTFSITLANAPGFDDATGVIVTDMLPSGYGFVADDSASSGTSYTAATGVWNVGALAAGSSADLNITATVLATGAFLNVAEVTAADQTDTDSTPGDGLGDDHATATATPTSAIDLFVTKTVDDTTPTVGSNVVFTVTAANSAGFSDATGVQVSDPLPSGYVYLSDDSAATSTNYVSGAGVWDIGAIASGSSVTLNITATVLGSGDYLNIAEISAADQPDVDSTPGDGSGDDFATATASPAAQIDLSMSATVSDPAPPVGSTVAMTFELSNAAGLSDATNVVVSALLPTGYGYIADDAAGNYDAQSGLWNAGTIVSGSSSTLLLDARVMSAGDFTQNAEVVLADQVDVDSTPADGSGDDFDSFVVVPTPAIDLSLTKTVDTPTPALGTNVTFTLQLENDAGFSDASGIVVTDLLPSGYTYVSDDGGGDYTPASGQWVVSNLAAGSVATLDIVASVNASGDHLNRAEVTAADQVDIDSTPANGDTNEDDHAQAATTPSTMADLSLDMVVDETNPDVMSQVVISLTLNNTGPTAASGVVVQCGLPSGYTYISDSALAGAYDAVAGTWSVGTVPVGDAPTLEIVAMVNPIGDYIATAEVGMAATADPDSTPGNSVATEDDWSEIATVPRAIADLSLAMTVDDPAPLFGGSVVFTLTLTNDGPSAASGVVVRDLLPSGYTYTSDDAGGSYDPITGEWNVGSIAADTAVELTLTATVNPSGDYANAAEVWAAVETDPDSTPGNGMGQGEDDEATQVVLLGVDEALVLNKGVDRREAISGDAPVYTIQIRNTEAIDIPQVTIEDRPPLGFKYRPGTARLDGVPIADPVGARPLNFSIGDVPALVDGNGNGVADPGEPGYRELSYQLVIGSGALPGTHANLAQALSICADCVVSNQARVNVDVRLDPALDFALIVGKVFHDKNEDGRQGDGEPGVAEAMIALDDGTYAVTDPHGRYHLPAVKPGQRMLKVNRFSLPPGAVVQQPIRILWLTPGLMGQADFAISYDALDTESIGRPEQRGLAVASEQNSVAVDMVGNADTLSLFVAGQRVLMRNSDILLGIDQIDPVVQLGPGGLEEPVVFAVQVDQPETIANWTLSIHDTRERLVYSRRGLGSPQSTLRWDGKNSDGTMALFGGIYTYQLVVEWADGGRSTSPLRLLGVDRGEFVSLQLTGEAFEFGSERLSARAREALRESAATLHRFPDERIVIEGHTDSVGAAETNLDLSRRRAQAALDYLVEVERFPRDRFIIQGYGESRPIATNELEDGRALNRRVEIKGELEHVSHAALSEAQQIESSLRVNDRPVELGQFGEFHHQVDPDAESELEIEISDSQGRSVRETVQLPRLELDHPSGSAVLQPGEVIHGCSVVDQVSGTARCRIEGQTDPGNSVEHQGRSLAVDPEGRFALEVSVDPSGARSDLLVRNPQGVNRVIQLVIRTADTDAAGNPLVLVQGVPSLTVELPGNGTKLSSATLPIRGTTQPEHQVAINGTPCEVRDDGTFSTTVELPSGKSTLEVEVVDSQGRRGVIERELEVPMTQLFLLAFADGKLSSLDADGALDPTGLDEDGDLFAEGRVAFYLKGRIKGKYLITSAFDSYRDDAEYLFRDLEVGENSRLLRNLDPDRMYPIYGDSSTVVYDAESQGNFYLALEGEAIEAFVGNHALALDDTELATYRRTMYGAKFRYISTSQTDSGAPNTEVMFFANEVEQRHIRDELRATGASLYYLSQRDVIEGSEHVTLIVRDRNTELILSRETQQQNLDYTIKYPEGRLMFHRPISSVIPGGSVVNQEILSGHRVFIQVDYDVEVDGFSEPGFGGRVRQQVGERFTIGGTYVQDQVEGGEYELSGVDAELRLPGGRIVAELADSSGNDSLVFVSDDGGLSFTAVPGNGAAEGQAQKLAAEFDVGQWFGKPERYQVRAYFKELDPGFASSGSTTEEGTRKIGFEATIQLTDRDLLHLRHDQEQRLGTLLSGSLEEVETQSFQWDRKHDNWGVSAEYFNTDRRDTSGASLNDSSLVATRLWWKPTGRLTTRLDHQHTLDGLDNDQTRAGLTYDAASWLALEVEGVSGSQGESAKAGAIITHKGSEIYVTRELSERPGDAGATNVIGSRAPIGPSSQVYSEYRWGDSGPRSQAISLLGVQQQWDLSQGLRIAVSGEAARVDAAANATRRTAFNTSLSYRGSKHWSGTMKNAIRIDDGTIDRRQWIGFGQLDFAFSDDLTGLARYRFSNTEDRDSGSDEADYFERTFSLAYRPVAHNRLNSILRYTSLTDRRPIRVDDDGEREWEVISLDASYRLWRRLQLQTKGALRTKSEEFDALSRYRSRSQLFIQRINVTTWKPVDFGIEYRTFVDQDADDERNGWLLESTWQLHQHFRVGAGYNFTDFSDDLLTDHDYSVAGWFLRVQGMY